MPDRAAHPPTTAGQPPSRMRLAIWEMVSYREQKIEIARRLFLALALAMALIHDACGADSGTRSSARSEPPTQHANMMKIRITVNGKATTATLLDSDTTRDFISLLPLTLTMNDLFGREKFGHLPRAISTDGKRTHTYEVGDVAYWSPGPDVAIYYRHDGEKIPAPGIIAIGKMDSGVQALDMPGSVRVTFEPLE